MTSDIHHTQDGKPLSHSDTEKRRLERDAAKLFMRAYEREFHQPIRHIWHNEPAKPDISCYLQGEALDLEIAHLYASENEARIASGDHPRETDHNHYHGDDHLWSYLADLASLESGRKLHTALNRILVNKARKRYHSKRVWLVIRNASPLWNRDDFLPIVRHLKLPHHHFEKIWLIPDFPGEQELIEISRSAAK